METLNATLAIATVQEAITVTASSVVIDLSAKLGVNVSPEEVENLPVNGRNFANLMTLATGATSDGNGGWASVRFNGKSNQQNYLNYDGVDGTYVFDASPGVPEHDRLAVPPADIDGVGVGVPRELRAGACGERAWLWGQHHGRHQERRQPVPWLDLRYRRDDAMDSASEYDDTKQELSLDQFGGSIGGPIAKNRTFFFFSFEGLRQTTGLRFTEALPSDETRRRIRRASRSAQAPARARPALRQWRPCSVAFRWARRRRPTTWSPC